MQDLGCQNLQQVISGMDLSDANVISIGIKIMQLLEYVHKSGYIYNDLKPDNIIVRNLGKGDNIFLDADFSLVDFGFCTKFYETKKSKDGSTIQTHIPKRKVDSF